MTIEKISGFLLVIGGVSLIGYALFAGFQTFIGGKEPPQIFQPQRFQGLPSKPGQLPLSPETLQQQLNLLLKEQLQSLFPTDAIFRILNFSAFSVFLGLLIFGGSQIAGIGIKLLKER